MILRRLGAFGIDIAVIVAFILITQVVLRTVSGVEDALTSGIRIELWVLATITLPAWLYFAYFESSRFQGTIGKLTVGLYVVDAERKRINFRKALIRAILKFLPIDLVHLSLILPTPIYWANSMGFRFGFLMACALAVSYLVAAKITPKHQSVHDVAAGTFVVEETSPEQELTV